ncbi:MAG TPA: PEP-CTERM sorting domain-containing protein [Candidatus Aquabacterium excrementipullorum]|nr:PEP-CTERM sorting domain-containing protein [Candidatus Aquabacterium excrementipullorum]
MKLQIKLLAAATALVASASSFAVVNPGDDLGTLNQYPVQFGGYRSIDDARIAQPGDLVFSHDYTFTLAQTASVIGSVSNFFGNTSFSSITVTSSGGQSWTKTLNDVNDSTFDFAGLTAGNYTLSVNGVFPLGFNVYSGSVYAAAPVPEPGSLALGLAGLGIVGVLARRRRPQA